MHRPLSERTHKGTEGNIIRFFGSPLLLEIGKSGNKVRRGYLKRVRTKLQDCKQSKLNINGDDITISRNRKIIHKT